MEKKILYGFYIFNGRGACLYSENWNRKSAWRNDEEDHKLMYGMLFSMSSFVKKSSPKSGSATLSNFTTSTYRLHSFETPTRFKFLMVTDPHTENLKDELRYIYSNIFVEYVIKNPFYNLDDPVRSELFVSQLQKHLRLKFSTDPAHPPTNHLPAAQSQGHTSHPITSSSTSMSSTANPGANIS